MCISNLGLKHFDFGGDEFTLLNPSICKEMCLTSSYFGLSRGNSCKCADRLDTLINTSVDNETCLEHGTPCVGGEKCGGIGKIAVWKHDLTLARKCVHVHVHFVSQEQ